MTLPPGRVVFFLCGLIILAVLADGQSVHPSNVQEISAPAADLGAEISAACKAAGPDGQIKINVTRGIISTP
ncbi:MAG: hypothetical protein ACRD4F_16095, partial [Candidatus Angelobacter sp.]